MVFLHHNWMSMTYPVWKLVHIVAVIAFLGNIATGLFWAIRAHKTRDLRFIASTFDGIIRSDRWVTLPGVAGMVIAGVGASIDARLPILSTGWIFWSIVLLSISGVIFAFRVAPLQRSLLELAVAGDNSALAMTSLDRDFRHWERWGLIALMAPLMALVLMVLKPSLAGL